MSTLTQFRHYLISQDAGGSNIEIARNSDQVGVLAFDSQRFEFVNCHVLLEPLKNRRVFEERAAKLQQVGHPLLARVLEAGEDEGSPYYITENVDGETLQALLARHEQIPVWLAVQLTILSLEALRAVATRGDYVMAQPLERLRVVQTTSDRIVVIAADYRLAESAATKASRSRLVKSAFDKQGQFLAAYFAEQAQSGKNSGGEPQLSSGDFTELLHNLLLSCGPDTTESAEQLQSVLVAAGPNPPAGEIAAAYKPRPLIAPLLASFQEVARSVVQTVRMQSQRLDASQPYSLRGTLMKTGQSVIVSQVPPLRLAGTAPGEALRQARNPPKGGKYPNLVPVVFVEEREGIECLAETAVEGVPLHQLLDARGALDAHETYLVLAGVDAALGQLEKAARVTRRLRLDDIFLFTGFGSEGPRESGLLETKLNEWPGFSIVLRAHPCLHAMAGRGTDPAMLLPVEPRSKGDAEPLWNGGWMAALGAHLVGMDETGRKVPFSQGMESVARMLSDELVSARKGSPSSRASFLARFVRVMREHDLAQVKTGGFWQELSGDTTAQGRASEVARAAVPAQPLISPTIDPVPDIDAPPQIGFAEALIRSQAEAGRRGFGGMESSWTGFREKKPLWIRAVTLGAVSLALGAVLAQLQGRAVWQPRQVPPKAETVQEPPAPVATPVLTPDPELKEKPSAPAKTVSKEKEKEPAPATPGPPKIEPSKSSMLVDVNLDPVPKKGAVPGAPSDDALIARLRDLRQNGGRMNAELRSQAEQAAKRGITDAMIALGNAMLRGDGGAVDERGAFALFDKALQAGDKSAMVPLASCYLQGWGIAPDFQQAVSLLNRATSAGDSQAKDLLGVCFARGLGVTRDDARAFKLCTEAYQEGVPSACGNLGAMYLRGQGVAADPVRAAALFFEGAKKGHAESMLLYAQCLENGTGIASDRSQSARWYRESARAGNAEAAAWCQRNGVAL